MFLEIREIVARMKSDSVAGGRYAWKRRERKRRRDCVSENARRGRAERGRTITIPVPVPRERAARCAFARKQRQRLRFQRPRGPSERIDCSGDVTASGFAARSLGCQTRWRAPSHDDRDARPTESAIDAVAPRRLRRYVPSRHDARYLACAGVSVSIESPIVASLSAATSWSTDSGTV